MPSYHCVSRPFQKPTKCSKGALAKFSSCKKSSLVLFPTHVRTAHARWPGKMSGMLLYTSMGLRLRGPTRPYGSYAINYNQSGALPSNISLRNYCCCSLGVPLARLVSSLLLRFAPHWYPHSDQLQRSRYLINTLASKQAMRVSKVIRKEICEIGRFWARHWKVGVLKACPLRHKCLEIRVFFSIISAKSSCPWAAHILFLAKL